MNKALAYVATAIIFGLVMTLVPTWLFLVRAEQQGKLSGWFEISRSVEDLIPPWLDSEQDQVETVSSKEVEILGISFVAASIVYVLFKRKTPRYDRVWPPVRPS